MNQELLSINHLTVEFNDYIPGQLVLDDLSMSVGKAEIVGIVGESGSGKSLTSLAVMGLLNKDAKIKSGQIMFGERDLLKNSAEQMSRIRGNQISMIFQEPMSSLNPVMKIGTQVGESLQIHSQQSKEERYQRVISALEQVGLKHPQKLYHKYPHQLSGGMRQRVMIAMAMINEPDLLIADEPTTALDVTVQAEILNLLKQLHTQTGTSILFISHDLNVIKEICSRVIVMYQGRIVEEGPVHKVLYAPEHAYTKQLVADIPTVVPKESQTKAVLEVEALNVFYRESNGAMFGKNKQKHVIKDLSLDVYEGEILGIVGESGCGKSTLAKTIAGLHQTYSGTIKHWTASPQMVFQDPYGSLNPAKRIGWILEEPLKIAGEKDKQVRKKKVDQMMKQIGLDKSFKKRYIRKLSGGQRQRISIGTALMNHARLIIADEPVSALDVTIQGQILKLLLDLKERYGLTYIFISHDLNVVRSFCHRVIVMYNGEIMEEASAEDIYLNPRHPYTKKLFDSILSDDQKAPKPQVEQTVDHTSKEGQYTAEDVLMVDPEASTLKPACSFYKRCPWRTEKCMETHPGLEALTEAHKVRCHYAVKTENGE